MSTAQMIGMALVASTIVTLILVILLLIRPWDILSPKTVEGQKNRHRIKKVYDVLALRVYKILRGFALTRIYIINLSSSLGHMYMLEEDEANVSATSLLLKEAGIIVVTMLASLRYFDDTFLALIATVMIAIYAYQKLVGDGQKFLEELEESIGDMVHIYNAEGKNIDRMFSRLTADRESYICKYLDQMQLYIKRALLDPENSQFIIAEYNKLVPSRHLRLIFNYIYITARYGDEENVSGEQLFNRNMLAIQREVHEDLVKMTSIKEETLGEQWFIILAVVMIPAASWYMNTFFTFEGFESIGRFLNSSFGYTIKIVCSVFALLCFFIYTRLMSSNVAFDQHREIKWTEVLLDKYTGLKMFIDKIAPKEGTKRRKNLENSVAMTEGYIGIRPLYVKKLCSALVVTVIVTLLLSVDTFTIYKGITTDIYRGVNSELMDTIISLDEYPETYKSQSLSNDVLVMDILDQNKEEYMSISSTDEKVGYIQTIIRDNGIDYGAYPEIASQRISEKYILLDRIDAKIMLLVILIALMGSYMLPNLTMKLNLTLNQGAIIYDEVIGCYTVVILLVNHSASNVYILFNWLTSFANVFKVRLQQCMDNLSEKEIKALEDGVNYKPFSRLIECTLLAYNGADLKSAFAGIEQRHLFQEESRRLINKQVIQRRVFYSQALSWGALGCTFLLYIVAPMVMSIVEMMMQLL